jgi:hypothetical protein
MAEKQATLWLKIKSTGEEVVSGLKEKFDSLGGVVGLVSAAFAGFSAIIVKSIAEYKEKEVALKELTTAMINNGIYSADLADKYKAQADAISQLTLFEDDQVIKSQAVIQQLIGQREVSQELTMAIADLAQAKGKTLAEAAEMAGKAIAGGRNQLAAFGIEVSDSATKSEKMAQVIEGLNRQFGGQAEAATQGLGAMGMFNKAMNDLFETIGERIAPVLVPFIQKWTEFVAKSNEVKQGVELIDFGFRALVNTVNIVSNVISTAWNLVMNAIGTAAALIGEIVAGNFKRAGNMAVEYFKGQGQIIKDAAVKTYDEIVAVDQAYTEKKKAEIDKREQHEIESLERQKEARDIKAAEDDAVMLEELIKEEQHAQALIVNEEKLAMAKLQVRQKQIDDELKQTTDARIKAKLLAEKYDNELLITEQKNAELRKQNQKDTLGTIAGMQNSSNKTLATIGKAAALTQIAIDTPVAIGKAMAAFPPPFNFIAAGAVGAAMAAQAAQVAGIQLAEGGIVMPRPGGVQATIAEAGQAEAVIPLDKMGDMGLSGGQVHIHFSGPMLGDQSQAYEFAKAIDNELYNLRKSGSSKAFDSGLV